MPNGLALSASASTTAKVKVAKTADPIIAKSNLSGVTLNVADTTDTYQALLKASGLGATPYNVNYVQSTSTSVSLTGVKAGSVDLFLAGELPAIFGAAGSYPFKLVQAEFINVNSTGVLVPKNSPIKTVAQLKGKTVAVNLGSNAQKVLYGALAKVGLKPTDINLVNLLPAAALPAFLSGSIDAWATFDPNTSIAEAEYGARMLVDGSNGISTGVNYIAASDSALANQQKVIAMADYTYRLQKAYAWANEKSNGNAYVSLLDSIDGLPNAVNVREFHRGPPTFKPISAAIIKASQKTANAFVGYGSIAAVNLEPYFSKAVDKILYAKGVNPPVN